MGAGGVRALVAAAALIAAAAHGAGEEKVLTIYAETRVLPSVTSLDHAIRSTFHARSPAPVQVYTEYLDLSWFSGRGPEELMARVIREKYAGRNIGAVITCGEPAIRFVLRNRASLFPRTPLVFCAADFNAVADLKLDGDVTGVTLFMDWADAASLLLRLHPRTRRIAFIGGAGPTAREWEAQARTTLAGFSERVEITWLTGLPMTDLLKQAAALPEGTVVLFNAFIRDGAGHSFTSAEALALVAGVTKAPIYALDESLLGHGIVGGPMVDFAAQGAKAAELARRILDGERLGPADIVRVHENTYMFDARQLERLGIAEDQLPANSMTRFREVSTWTRHKSGILLAVGLTALQTLLIAGLLVGRLRRKRAERGLDERLRFETLISELATGFIKFRAEEIDRQIGDGLRRVVEELGVDRASIGEFTEGGDEVRVTHSWARKDIPLLPVLLDSARLPWTTGRIRSGHVVSWSRSEELPEEATTDRSTIAALQIRSMILVPLSREESVGGVLACSVLRDERQWREDLMLRVRMLGEIFAIVLLRRRAHAALEESEARFRLMADAAPVMIWTAGPDGLCVDFNRAWLEFTGRTLEQEKGEGWAEGVHPDDRDACVSAYMAALAERRPFTLEYRLRRADGVYRWVVDYGAPRFGGAGDVFNGYVGSVTDVTQMKEAHRSLIESAALRSAIFGSLYGEVVALSREGVILAVNEAWTRFAQESGGDPAETAVGANYLELCRRAAAVGDREAAKAVEAIEAVLAGRAEGALLEHPRQTPSGTRWYSMAVEPFRRPEGGVVISRLDVTRRRKAEEEAEHGREELAHALRVATLGELAATLAHEINQPLTAILSNSQAVRRMLDAPRVDHTELAGAVQDISEDARRAADVIRRVRVLFRKDHSERRPVDVNDAVREVMTLLRKDLERKRISLHLDLGPRLPPVLGDLVQLQQVLVNVVVNACDAMNGTFGGPRDLRIKTTRADEHRIRIDLSDSGTGVKDEELTHMFERFVTSKPDGLGMGLSISRSIIEAHGGRIWATRNEGRGLTIHSELPCAASS